MLLIVLNDFEMNKNQHISTNNEGSPEAVNSQIGLTAIQERCAIMLASGSTITEVAETLHLDRGTIYSWKKKVTFTCYLNRLQIESKDILKGNLFELQGQALQALKDSLVSSNEAIRLKAAVWLIERLASSEVGAYDPKEAIRQICSKPYIGFDETYLDRRQYIAMLEESGLELDE